MTPTKESRLCWLAQNVPLWERYPRPKQVGMLSHHEWLFRTMKRAGLYPPNVTAIESDLSRLINLARRRRAQLQTA